MFASRGHLLRRTRVLRWSTHPLKHGVSCATRRAGPWTQMRVERRGNAGRPSCTQLESCHASTKMGGASRRIRGRHSRSLKISCERVRGGRGARFAWDSAYRRPRCYMEGGLV